MFRNASIVLFLNGNIYILNTALSVFFRLGGHAFEYEFYHKILINVVY